jgi:hypothetical protein
LFGRRADSPNLPCQERKTFSIAVASVASSIVDAAVANNKEHETQIVEHRSYQQQAVEKSICELIADSTSFTFQMFHKNPPFSTQTFVVAVMVKKNIELNVDDEACWAFLDDNTPVFTVIQKHELVLIRCSSVLTFHKA